MVKNMIFDDIYLGLNFDILILCYVLSGNLISFFMVQFFIYKMRMVVVFL